MSLGKANMAAVASSDRWRRPGSTRVGTSKSRLEARTKPHTPKEGTARW